MVDVAMATRRLTSLKLLFLFITGDGAAKVCEVVYMKLPKLQKRTMPSVWIEPTTLESWVQHPNH